MSKILAFKDAASPQTSETDIRIFLDLDGVIADFDSHTKAHDKRWTNGWIKYKELDTAWWVSMPSFDGAKDFYDQLVLRAPTKFLTASPPTSGSDPYSAKATWVMNFAERDHHALKDLILCSRADKCLMAGPKRILIDDKAENIAEWVAAGGIGIHHKGNFADTLRRLDVELAKLKPVSDASVSAPVPAGP